MIDRQTKQIKEAHCYKRSLPLWEMWKKKNMLSDNSVHGLNGLQKSKIFKGEEAIKNKTGCVGTWGVEGGVVEDANITRWAGSYRQTRWSKQSTIHRGFRATNYRHFHHVRWKRVLSLENKQKQEWIRIRSVELCFPWSVCGTIMLPFAELKVMGHVTRIAPWGTWTVLEGRGRGSSCWSTWAHWMGAADRSAVARK